MNKKGMALPVVIILVLCLTLTAATFVLLSSNELGTASRQNASTQAFYIAEGANELCATWMQQNPAGAISIGNVPFNPLGTIGQTYPLGVGNYTLIVTPSLLNPTAPTANINVYTYTLSSTGIVDGVSRTVEADVTLEVENTTFAQYSYFTVSESYLIWLVWFTSGSFLEGPVHTNGQYNISGDPIFDGPVSSVAATINYMNGGPPADNPDFRQGITLGVPAIDTTPLSIDALEDAAALAGGYTFNGGTTVVLKSDGTMDVENDNLIPNNQNMPLPANGALYVTAGNLKISGTLNGSLTAGSSRGVVIKGNINYNNDPRIDPNSTDILALMGKRDVKVHKNAANDNPGYDLEIFASIHAIGQGPSYGDDDGSFYVQNYWDKIRGVLTVYGGIVQKNRGPVGTFYSATGTKASGYDKNYHYDIRMATSPPPYVPSTTITTFNRISWQETFE